MKRCPKCKELKSTNQFCISRSRKDGLQVHCKNCKLTYNKNYYSKNKVAQKQRVYNYADNSRDKIYEYLKDHPCIDCGINNPIVLQFDHMRDKTCNVSKMIKFCYSWETMLVEIEKCEVRCANCHSIKTAKERNWYKYKKWTDSLETKAAHS